MKEKMGYNPTQLRGFLFLFWKKKETIMWTEMNQHEFKSFLVYYWHKTNVLLPGSGRL